MRRREEYAYVLDVIPPEVAMYKLPARVRREFPHDVTYAHLLGEEFFTLLEVTIKRGATVEVGERLYVGAGQRDKVDKIVRRIRYEDLQPPAREALPQVVRKIVAENERRFIKWINDAGPLTIKMHSLELLRGIGKKKAQEILEERRRRPFQSYEDVKQRAGVDLVELITDRVIREIMETDTYYMFVTPPPAERAT